MAGATVARIRRSMPVRVPNRLWVVAAVSLAWNAYGCLDFLLTMLRDPGTMSALPMESRYYIETLPLFVVAAWGLATWGSMVGTGLLFARSRHAPRAFELALLGLAVYQIHQWRAYRPVEMSGDGSTLFIALTWGVLLGLVWFSRLLRHTRVLR